MFLIAELSCNHNGSLQRAFDTINLIVADAVKFQTWTPGTMAVPHEIKTGPWKGYNLPDLYKRAHTPWDWHMRLFEAVRENAMIPMSTPFDKPSVDFLEELECPIYKIASFELVDLPLISYVAQTGKPMIISTGMASTNEIRAAVKTAREHCTDLTLLHCVSEYPTPLENVNLKTMQALKRFNCNIGLSDHSTGELVVLAATALGAQVIEKHVTLTKDGLDKDFSMLPADFNDMGHSIHQVETILGKIKFGGGDKYLRRSLYFNTDLKAGTTLKESHFKTARPALGLPPISIDKVLGKKLSKNVKENDPVQTITVSLPRND